MREKAFFVAAAAGAVVAIAGVGAAGAIPPSVFINEIRIDQSGGDSSEYFELRGAPGTSLTGLWLIVMGDVSSSAGVVGGDQSGRIESVTDLTGLSIPADGYFLAAESTFGTGGLGLSGSVDLTVAGNGLNFENSDNLTFFLVTGFSGLLNDDIDTNDDGILDSTPWTSIIDEIALVENLPPLVNQEFVYSTTQLGPDGTFVPGHAYTFGDTGPWTIGSFFGGADTPGTANIPAPAGALVLAFGGLLAIRRRR